MDLTELLDLMVPRDDLRTDLDSGDLGNIRQRNLDDEVMYGKEFIPV